MNHTVAGCLLFVAGIGALTLAPNATAQGLSVDVSAGRTAYDVLSTKVGTNNAMGTIRYDAARGAWVYGTAATPLRSGDPAWGAFGAGGRLAPWTSERRRLTLGVDLDGSAFLYRDAVTDQSGQGGSLNAIPFASLAAGNGHIDLRGGWRGYTLDIAGAAEHRGVFETGVRGSYGGMLRLQGDLKWVHASEGTYPFAGVSFVYSAPQVQVWAQTGKWLSNQLDTTSWAAGFGVGVGPLTTIWADVRQEAPDPLYWNATRRTWGVGITRRFGRSGTPPLSTPTSTADGVVIRVAAADAKGDAIFVAGDFNNWQPAPMHREGQVWEIRLPLSPGVYRYAFRSATGEWFVPASTPGRRDDGMGGYVAVLVVI